MNRITFMIVLAIIGLAAAIGILRFISEPVPQKIVQPNEEIALPPEEMPVVQEPVVPAPEKIPENKQQVVPQSKPQTRVNTASDVEPNVQYRAGGSF